MKFFLLALLIFPFLSRAESGRQIWRKANTKGKARLIEQYRDLLLEWENSQSEILPKLEEKKTTHLFKIFHEAWAGPQMDCLYAGWPSRRASKLCSSPLRQNPHYDKGSCQENELQCQPMLFGKGLCAPISTSTQRQLAFSHCEKEFQKSQRSSVEVVKEVLDSGKEAELLEFMDLADRICKEGQQSRTPMCRKFQEVLERIRASHGKVKSSSSGTEEETKSSLKLLTQVQKAAETTGRPPDCDEDKKTVNSKAVKPFERVNTRIQGGCERFPNQEGYTEIVTFDCKTSAEYPSGYLIRSDSTHPYLKGVKSPYPDGGSPTRTIEFYSLDRSQNGTYLNIMDTAGGPDSHDVKSMVFLLPRKGVPEVKAENGEIRVTLTTGEEVTFDKATGAIKNGSLKEGPLDLNTNRHQRTPPNVHYTGKGISLRLNHRFDTPTMAANEAEVRQGDRVCKIPRTLLWNSRGELIPQTDVEIIRLINKKCPKRASEKEFSVE